MVRYVPLGLHFYRTRARLASVFVKVSFDWQTPLSDFIRKRRSRIKMRKKGVRGGSQSCEKYNAWGELREGKERRTNKGPGEPTGTQ